MSFAPIYLGIVAGTLARIALLKIDYRNYPSYPNSTLIHLTIGFVAASLGAVAVPALLAKQWVAVTFLALAVQQFREVRNVEAKSLTALEDSEQVPRGSAYITGIAKSFEARNYVALLVALVTSGFTTAFLRFGTGIALVAGAAAGAGLHFLLQAVVKDERVADVASVREARLHFKDHRLYADQIYLDNVGLEMHRKRIEREGLAVIIEPFDHAGHITLANFGQRRAILHEVSRLLGLKRFHGMRRDFNTGAVAFYLIPMKRDIDALIRTVKNVPLLEGIRRDKDVSTPGPPGLGADREAPSREPVPLR